MPLYSILRTLFLAIITGIVAFMHFSGQLNYKSESEYQIMNFIVLALAIIVASLAVLEYYLCKWEADRLAKRLGYEAMVPHEAITGKRSVDRF